MAIKTTLEQIEEVQMAISAVMSGQEVRSGGKSLRMADLPALQQREEMLLARYRSEQGGGLTKNTGQYSRE